MLYAYKQPVQPLWANVPPYGRVVLGRGRSTCFSLRPRSLIHLDPVTRRPQRGFPTVTVDLARAMQGDPDLQILAQNRYHNLATPYFGTVYILQHLRRQTCALTHPYAIHAHAPALKQLHDTTAAFMRANRQRFPASRRLTMLKLNVSREPRLITSLLLAMPSGFAATVPPVGLT